MFSNTILLAAGFVLLWNSGFIGAEFGLPYSGPFTLLFWRYLALSILLFAYLKIRGQFRWVRFSTAAPNMLVGVLAHGVWLSCVLLALNYQVPAGIVALVVALQPMLTGALSGLFVGERTSITGWLGLSVGFGGVAFTVLSRINFQDVESIFGYLIPLGSVMAITIASLIQRKMEVSRAVHKLPLALSLFYQSIATTIFLAIPAVLWEKLATQWQPHFIYTMIWLIIGVSLGAYALMWLLLKRIDATRVASLFYFGPPVTMLMAWFAFGDIVQITDLIGMILVFVGVLLTQFRFSKIDKNIELDKN
jgi:drug/metabolite transporter (DMT)-like permease